jgi:hypothetical protein
MLYRKFVSPLLASVIATGAIVSLGGIATAQEPEAAEASAQEQGAPSQTGRVAKFLKNDRGDVDGLMLEGGVQIHFPPHIGRKVVDAIAIGDKIKVEGASKTRPNGEAVYEASKIVTDEAAIVVDRPRPPRGPRRPAKPQDTPMSTRGKIKAFARNPHGDMDGLVLEDGTEVQFGPKNGAKVQEFAEIGAEVQLKGHAHQTPNGEVRRHVESITLAATGKTLVLEERKKPRPGAGPEQPAARGDESATNAELLRELRAIRKLLEARQS